MRLNKPSSFVRAVFSTLARRNKVAKKLDLVETGVFEVLENLCPAPVEFHSLLNLDLGIDDDKMVEVIVRVEEKLCIILPDETEEDFSSGGIKTVQDLVYYAHNKGIYP